MAIRVMTESVGIHNDYPPRMIIYFNQTTPKGWQLKCAKHELIYYYYIMYTIIIRCTY